MTLSLAQGILDDFTQEADVTRPILAAVPAGRFDWKPHPKSMGLGQLAGHIAENPAWIPSMMEGDLDVATMEENWKPFLPESSDELLAKFDEARKIFTEVLDGRDDAFLSQTWRMTAGDKVMMEMPRYVAARSIGIRHLVHHRGQLTVYLRLLDVPVPGTYGPTADSAEF